MDGWMDTYVVFSSRFSGFHDDNYAMYLCKVVQCIQLSLTREVGNRSCDGTMHPSIDSTCLSFISH